MYKQVLQGIEGIEIYPIISMIVFILFFITIIIWIIKADKNYLKKMGSLPLENDNPGGGSK
jgi:hypothetical protein